MINRRKILTASSVLLLSSLVIPQAIANGDSSKMTVDQRTEMLEKQLKDMQKEIKALKTQKTAENSQVFEGKTSRDEFYKGKTNVMDYLDSLPVSSSPYLGLRSSFSDDDLIINLPSVNEDLRLLKQHQKLEAMLKKEGLPLPARPFVEISGKVEAQAKTENDFGNKQRSDIDLSTAELDTAIYMAPWATGFMNFVYDSSPPATPGGGKRTANSRLFIDRAFVTVGNFDEFPMYASAGQMFVPFGQYKSYMISSTLPQLMARTKERALLIGYKSPSDNGFYGSVFGFKGDSKHRNRDSINNYGANAAYAFHVSDASAEVGVSVMRNIADADGMQSTGASSVFTGFSSDSSSNVLKRVVPGLDLRGSMDFGNFEVLAEYVTALRSFDDLNATYNGSSAKPWAVNAEAVYKFDVFSKSAQVAVGYSHTDEALAFNLPKDRLSVVYDMNIWKNTIAGVEYRLDENYGKSSTSTGTSSGTCIPVPPATSCVPPVVISGPKGGGTAHTYTAHFGIYF